MDSVLQDFLSKQGYALCEYLGNGEFSLLAPPPPWFSEIWNTPTGSRKSWRLDEQSPFLKNFLVEAEAFWNSQASGVLPSGVWMERTSKRGEVPLEAVALRVAGKRLLSMQSDTASFNEQTRRLQVARDGQLVHERLLKEIQKKEILLHGIIHDLSQPLTAMRGCFECLALEGGSARMKQLVDVGKQQSEQQEAMIREVLQAFSEDLQDAVAESAGERAAPNLLRCAEATVAAFTPMFQSRGLLIRIDPRLQGHEGWEVSAEYTRLRRVLSNLVENALRYAPAGSVVTLGVEEDEPYIKAYVDDQGSGPKDLVTNAFRLSGKGKEDGGKAGLGLYFCRVTVERWGGTIGCESLVPRGSRFWFRLLQVRKAAARDARIATGASREVGLPKTQTAAPVQVVKAAAGPLRILLAEDDPAIRELTELLLTRQGHKVVAVSSGQDALRALASRRFDVLLLDDEMPGLSGAQTVKRVRAGEKSGGKRQFILSLSGNSTEADKNRLHEAGVDACLSKPFHADELHHALAQFATAPPHAPAKAQRVSKDGGYEPQLLARAGGDPKLLRRVIETFLKNFPKKITAIRAAMQRQDSMALAGAAHALKGSVSIFGGEEARSLAEQLQDLAKKGRLADAAQTSVRLEEEIAKLEIKLRGYTADAHPTSSPSGKAKARVGKPRKRR
jgi:signal transduction histidine kinase/DNA-binding NarL/FixJ family response regulator